MLYDLTLETAVQKVGHTGADIWWPACEEPMCRRGFHCQEFVEAAFHLGYALVQYDAAPVLASPGTEPRLVYPAEILDARLANIMTRGPGLILGQQSLKMWHMVAWDGDWVFDPDGPKRYKLEDSGLTIDTFWLSLKIDKRDWVRSESAL